MWQSENKIQTNKPFEAISDLGSPSAGAVQAVPNPATMLIHSPKITRLSTHPDTQVTDLRCQEGASPCWVLGSEVLVDMPQAHF